MKKKTSLQIKYLDGFRLERAVQTGFQEIIAHEGHLNKINVFPIPDRDTGSNLKETLLPVIECFPLSEFSLSRSSRAIADSTVSSALGYSGILFSHFLLGFAEASEGKESLDTRGFSRSATQGVKKAYASLPHPVEGTVLTVLSEWSDEVARLALTEEDFVPLLKESYRRAGSALQKTREQLDVLRKNKVVDAGGQAFLYFLEGIIQYVEKGKISAPSFLKKRSRLKAKRKEEGGICAECCVMKAHLDRIKLYQELSSLSDDLLFYTALDFAKVHVKTRNPDEVFSCTAKFGGVTAKKVFKFTPEMPSEARNSLALVSDTTCDLSDEFVENNDIYFIPVKFLAMERVFIDKVDIIPEDFYRILSSSPTLPKTSQPSFADFARTYEHLLSHYQTIISVHVSGALSGTFRTASQAAANIAPQRIVVLDGKNISVGLGLIMVEGIEALREGLDYENVVRRIKDAIENIEIFIGIPTLKYLVKGGRVTKAKGFLASLLNINPILSLNREGTLVPVGKSKGRKNLVQKVLSIASASIPSKRADFSVAVAHTNAPLLGQRVAERIREELGKQPVMVQNASPVLGAHGGPGVVGIAILKK